MVIRAIIGCGATFAISGCADFNALHREGTAGKTTYVAADEGQRFVFLKKRADDQEVTCPEPPPDVFSSYSFGGSAAAQAKGAQGNAAFAAGQASAFAGNRTSPVVLMRDAISAWCLGYANNALTPLQFDNLHKRNQNLIATLYAVEKLTGDEVPTVVQIGAGATAGPGAGLEDAQQKLDDARKVENAAKDAADTSKKSVDTAQTDLTTATKANETAKSTSQEKLKAAKTDYQAKQTAEATAKTAVDVAQKELNAATTDATKTAAQDKLTKATQDYKAKQDATAESKKTVDAAQKELDSTTNDSTLSAAQNKLQKAKDDYQSKQDAVKNAAASRTGWEAVLNQLRASSATAAPYFGTVSNPQSRSNASDHVADVVKEILESFNEKSFTGETCLEYISQIVDRKELTPTQVQMNSFCLTYLINAQAQFTQSSGAAPQQQGTPGAGKPESLGSTPDKGVQPDSGTAARQQNFRATKKQLGF